MGVCKGGTFGVLVKQPNPQGVLSPKGLLSPSHDWRSMCTHRRARTWSTEHARMQACTSR